MLVLRRKKAETIVLDGRIQIKVLRISRNTISLGIEAPSDVSIWRGELEQAEQPAKNLRVGGDVRDAADDSNGVTPSPLWTTEFATLQSVRRAAENDLPVAEVARLRTEAEKTKSHDFDHGQI